MRKFFGIAALCGLSAVLFWGCQETGQKPQKYTDDQIEGFAMQILSGPDAPSRSSFDGEDVQIEATRDVLTIGSPNAGKGDTLYAAANKIQNNFLTLFDAVYTNAPSSLVYTNATISDGTNTATASQIVAAKTESESLRTLSGTASSATTLGPFTGTIVPDNPSVKAAIQAIETDVDALQTLTGVAAESTNLSTFTGDTIPDSQTVKSAFQSLETQTEKASFDYGTHSTSLTNKRNWVIAAGSTVTLPESPFIGQRVWVYDSSGTSGVTPININDSEDTLVTKLESPGVAKLILWDGSLWKLIVNTKDNPGRVYRPEDYGADGTDSADDTAALIAAFAAAGTNGKIDFKPGSTYITYRGLVPGNGLVINGNNSILKRGPAITTVLASNFTAPGNVINVADATSFKVGFDINIHASGVYDNVTHTITAISGNQITVSGNFTNSYLAGATVTTSSKIISGNSSNTNGFSVVNLTFDGNSGGNTAFQKWDLHYSLTTSPNSKIHGCRFLNAQADAIGFFGDGVSMSDCQILNSQGNGIHFSGVNGGSVTGVRIENSNLGSGLGHEDGAIIWSNSCQNLTISDCFVDNAIAGIGSLDSSDNSNNVISNCIFKNCTSFAIDAFVAGTSASNITVSGCLFDDCVKAWFGNNSGKINVTGNTFIDTNVGFYIANDFVFSDNLIELSSSGTAILLSDSDRGIVSGNKVKGVGSNGLYAETACTSMTISGNSFNGMAYGIHLDNTAHENLNITGNTVFGVTADGIRISQGANTKGVVIANNTISGSVSSSGIICSDMSFVHGNYIRITGGAYGILLPSGGVGADGAYVARNVIMTDSGIPSIRSFGGTEGSVVLDNLVTQAASISGTHTVSGTVTITGL